MTGGLVNVVLPNDIDDPTRPSGGNLYDRRVCDGLATAGWSVREHAVGGAWPRPRARERSALARRLAALPDGRLVLLDGLIASAVPEVLAPQAGRLRLVVLVHMPLGEPAPELRPAEKVALSSATAIITTSRWCQERLVELYGLAPTGIHVATPGVDPAPLAAGSTTGGDLLCVAAVTPGKGHDVLVDALALIPEAPWRCVCVGPLDRDPDFADHLRKQAQAYGITDRLSFVGPQTGAELAARYAGADLFVLASRGETYGMVVTEALARGTPVVATAVNGLPEALGRAPDGSLPGLLVGADDPAALAGALRRWFGEPELRAQLRQAAQARRSTLTGWTATSAVVDRALDGIVKSQ